MVLNEIKPKIRCLVTLGHISAILWVVVGVHCVFGSVDLGIGFDKKTDRPNMFIAWRNTERILEVELEVKNYGDEQGTGSVTVSILDEEGKVLDSSPSRNGKPIKVAVPAFANGGKEGKVVQMHGSKSLNLLIDRLDRANAHYMLKAEVIPDGPDVNPYDKSAVKTFNISARARPGCLHFREYFFRNTTDKAIDLTWSVDTSPLPKGWEITAAPHNGEIIRVEPGAIVQGHAVVKTSDTLQEGDHLDVRFGAIDTGEKKYLGNQNGF